MEDQMTEMTAQTEQTTPTEQATPSPLPEQVKTETRGRHKKDCTCDKCIAKKGGTPAQDRPAQKFDTGRTISDTNPLNLDEFKKVDGITQQSTPQEVNAGKFITGGLMLICVDALLPATIIKVMSIFDKDLKTIKTKEIKLSSEQMEDLEPLASEAVKGMVTTMSPMSAFMTAMLMVYAGNTLSAVMDRKETIIKPEKQK